MVNINNKAVHLERAPFLVVGSAAWEVFKAKPLLCNDMEEQKTILGWLLDFCLMMIALPRQQSPCLFEGNFQNDGSRMDFKART
jgi:hypothetical protein